MEEQLIEELNIALETLWKFGRNCPDIVTLKKLEQSALMAIADGWNSESDESVDCDSAYWKF